jgi:hypothetical protein
MVCGCPPVSIFRRKQNLFLIMKRISMLAVLALGTTAAVAQRPADTDKAVVPTPVTRAENQASLAQGQEALANQGGVRNVVFQETFANGFDGSNGNGAWTVEDNVEGINSEEIWVWVAPGGLGYYADGTPTGKATHPAGAYSGNTAQLASETAFDGWVIFDNDFFHGGAISGDNPAVDTEGSITSPWLNLEENASVIVSWESYFRYCCFPYAPVYLEVGTTNEGVTSWTTFDAHGDFIESANTISANPLPVSVDVSCVAANQDSVQLRFAYRQAPEQGTAYSHYFWGIDDVTVSSNEIMHDVEITQIVNGDVYNVFEYRVTPLEQAILDSEGGLLAGVMYKNVGTVNQTNVEVLVEILDESGVVLSTTTEMLDTVLTYANAPTCPANTQDTLYLATGWEPDATGTYGLRITMTGDSADATPENNTLFKNILYTDDIYGHDDENVLDGELGPRESDDIDEYFDPTGYGSYFHCPNPGTMAYGLAVRFGPNCGLDIDGNPGELEFETRLYSLESVGLTDSPFDANYWLYDVEWSNLDGTSDFEVYLSFEDAIEMDEDAFYFAAVINEYESPTQLTVLTELGSDTDNSTGNFNQAGDGSFVWFTSQTSSPAVRLITSEREAVELLEASQGIRLEQCMPNPASESTLVRFELGQPRDVTLEVRDGVGRLVSTQDMGTLGAGQHNTTLDLSGWASGLYTYTLVADNFRTTKKLTVK